MHSVYGEPQTRTCNAANCSFSSSAHNVLRLTDVPLIVVPVMLMLALLLIPLLLVVLLRIVSPNGFAVGPLHDANKLKRCLFKSFDSNVAQLSTETDYGNGKCSIQLQQTHKRTVRLTCEILDHDTNEITKMYFHFANADILLVSFHFQIESSAVHVLNECRMQWHRFTFDDTQTHTERSIFGDFLQHSHQLQSQCVPPTTTSHILLLPVDRLANINDQFVHQISAKKKYDSYRCGDWMPREIYEVEILLECIVIY